MKSHKAIMIICFLIIDNDSIFVLRKPMPDTLVS